jgi:tight adherence protein B
MLEFFTRTADMLGVPLEAAAFLTVLLGILLAAPMILALSGPKAMARKGIGRLKKRQQKQVTAASVSDSSVQTASLRRTEGDSSLPLLSRTIGHWQSMGILRSRLARAGMKVTAERYLINTGLFFCICAGVPVLLGKSPLLFALLAIIAALGFPHIVVNIRIGQRKKRFLLLFPDAIELIVRGLKAGLPVTESIKMVAKEVDQPVGGVFQSMADKMALGVPLEKTLYETAQQYGITELDFFVTSIILQRETGGNLSEILANLSEALRQRTMMRLKIKAMSSEAKASMYIIGALPFFVIGALFVISPDYLRPLIEDFRGNIALLVAAGMLSTGIFIMMKMTQFEI